MSFWQKFTTEIYCIRISELEEGRNIFDLSHLKKLKDIRPPAISITDTDEVLADPFLFVKKNQLFLFFEDLSAYGAKGVIRMTRTENMHDWTRPVTVLQEPFHLSFPFVFEDNGEVYMIPETYQDLSVRLYKGNEDLTQWVYVKTLLQGEKYVDSFICIHDGIYYLFAPIELPDHNYIQNLYFSNSLVGNWVLHPSSPIALGKDIARNGGSMYCFDGKMYRPAQNCAVRYGGNVGICKVEILSTNEYREKLQYPDIVPKNAYYTVGGHHFCSVQFNGKTVVATDAIKRSLYFKNIARRIRKNILEYYHNYLPLTELKLGK